MCRIYELGLTTTSGGNLSLRDDVGHIWITPAGIDKGELRSDQVACVKKGGRSDAAERADGESSPPPSTELPFHRAIYAVRSDIKAVVHAHPVSLVAFSITQQVPDTRISAHCHAICGSAGFARYALPGSRLLGNEIAETFARGFDCVVLENHGVVVGGTTLQEAFERLEALDLCARTIMRARAVGEECLLSTEDLALAIESRSATALSAPAPIADARVAEEEGRLRRTLCAIARRAFARRLITSTQGALSARMAQDGFLLTPSGIPLDQLEPSNLLRVNHGTSGASELDPRQLLHATLYRMHPEVGAIAHGYAENTAGFGSAGKSLSARTIPESYILVREPGFISLRSTLVDPMSVALRLSPDNPVALIQNDGALTLGASILDAFDRLEVLEATAAALIASGPIGELAPMNDAQLAELREAFFPTAGFQGSRHGLGRSEA